MKHEIVVGNIGHVYSGPNANEAQRTFIEYCRQSRDNYGRAAGEPVTWFKDGEIYTEYSCVDWHIE